MVGKALRHSTTSPLVMGLLALLLVLAVACGAAAPPQQGQPAAPAPATGAQATPTAMPAQTAAPAAPAINPGKVTLMVSSNGNERFDAVYSSTVGKEYHKAFHGFLMSWELKDGAMVISPGIATKWETSNDGKTWTFTIRKGVKFHDGTEVTPEDVQWVLQHGIGPQAMEYTKHSVSITYATIMDKIEITGPDQVSVTTKVASPEFPVYISENEGGAGVAVVIPKRDRLHHPDDQAAFDRNPVGAGLVKLVKHVPLEVMSFERFEDHYYQPKNGLPTDKRLNFALLDILSIPEEATRAAALRAGAADIARISLSTRKQVESGGGRVVMAPEAVGFEVHLIGCWKPQFACSDKRVRHALGYALNKEIMRDRLYGGPDIMQVKGWWMVTPSTIGYSPDLAPFPYDPEKARQLMAEAGHPGGKDYGKLEILTYDDPLIPFLPDSAQLAADSWRRELGLDVSVTLMDKVKLTEIRSTAIHEFDGKILWQANNTRLDAAGIMRNYYFTKVKPDNAGRVHNDPAVFASVDNALANMAKPDAGKILNDNYKFLQDQSYQISLGYLNAPWGVGPRIVKWEPYPLAEYASAMHTIVLK